MRTIALILILLLTLSSLQPTIAQQQAVIKVVDPSGKPLEGVDVVLERGEERFRFQTNSTGHAIFLNLPEGAYDVKVLVDNVAVAEGSLDYPSQSYLELTAQISQLDMMVLNRDGEPVPDVRVVLRSSEGGVNRTITTGEDGRVVFERIPFSQIPGVGAYNITFLWRKVELLTRQVEVSQPEITLNITIPLIKVNMTVTNLEGEPVKGVTITLKSGELVFAEAAPDGYAEFVNIPSSEVPGVGEYLLNVSMRTRVGDIPIHSEKRALTESQRLDILTELGALEVKVVDEDGNPVNGLLVQLSNKLASNFTLATTDVNGTVTFRNVPLSIGKASAGEYIIQAIRQGILVGELRTVLDSPRMSVEIRVQRALTRITLRDYEGAVMPGYTITLRDEATGATFEETTGGDGSITLRLFFGTYNIEVEREGVKVFEGTIQIKGNEEELRIDSVNFPYRIDLKDGVGAPLTGVTLRVYLDDTPIHDASYSGPLTLRIPRPGKIRIDVVSGGELLHRETIFVDGPGGKTIRLRSYLALGGSVLALEDVGFYLALAAALAIMGLSILYARRGVRRRRES